MTSRADVSDEPTVAQSAHIDESSRRIVAEQAKYIEYLETELALHRELIVIEKNLGGDDA